MDEIDWIKRTKKAFILFLIISISIALFFTIASLSNPTNSDFMLPIILTIGVGFPTIIGIGFITIYIIYRVLYSGRTVINFDKNYIRDLPKHFNPAVCSLVHDLKIDVYKDYTAILLYLCNKKYVDLIKDGNTYKLSINKENIQYSDLRKCEKYVLDVIENNNKFDEDILKKEIINDAQDLGLITDKHYSKKSRVIPFIVSIIIFLILSYFINKILFIVVFILIVVALYAWFFLISQVSILDTHYIRTKEGNNLAISLKDLKRFIKEYTLINNKEIDYIQILENYIPYALVLGEADTVENFIKENEKYRSIIYNRK